MVWILPGRVDNPVQQKKAILETSYAFSRTLNPRNLEFLWYPLWGQTLSDLVADEPDLIVCSQFPVWTVPEDYEHEDEYDGDDPEEVEEEVGVEEAEAVEVEDQGEQVAAKRLADENDEDDNEDDEDDNEDNEDDNEDDDNDNNDDNDEVVCAGDISVAFTIPEKNAKGVVVDFAILSLTAVPEAREMPRYGGWRILTASVGLLVEVKRFASRSLQEMAQKKQILDLVMEAKEDLLAQAGYIFLHYEKKASVMCIAAAGPYWSSITIHRAHIGGTIHRLAAKDPDFRPPGKAAKDRTLTWTKVLRIDCKPSTNRLHTLYTKLKNLTDT